ncbi:hypothetical protein KL949_004853 [Ogataea haglerorum]|nr:hypothetical protein KL914_002957 [Ogataea haglerorum]KAG7708620.1 hypothetical protein KL950_002140 [Ogataea haglerorum]KAG7713790.1 hypothetical protein KL913_004814 [Ogataea haglerorum]KAG7714223.1 hypothetical protein KL949_004853 [Ogataea haglerorum]KAG7734377.1 hypothetical protein KL932_004831 [Ogataea haglerorum]
MLSYQDSAPSITSKSTRQSVYQTNGRPLSEEAIYRAKLKYGIYNNPAKVNLGVDPSASDTAALLASSSDLSVHPYKRELSAEAATAALIAKTDSAPRAWKRNTFAPEAEYAAISAKSQKYPFFEEDEDGGDAELSQDAASSVLRKSASATAKSALQDVYDFDDVRSGRTTMSNLHASSTPGTTVRGAYEASKVIDIGRILNRATDSATKSMNSRINPDQDFRSGLTTANAYTSANGAVDISKITFSAKESALKSMSSRLNPNRDGLYGIPTASDNLNNEEFASVGALASLNFDPRLDYAAAERATLARNSLIDNRVLIKAISNANAMLDQIDNKAVQDNIFGNREWNVKALQVAQANFEKRKNQTSGKIDVGGGLWMSIDEINRLASSVVTPILSDLNDKVEQQRMTNLAAQQRKAELKQAQAEFFAAQKQAKLEAKQRREAGKVSRRQKLQEDKDTLREQQAQMKAEQQAALEAKQQEFREQIEQEEKSKQELDAERNDKLTGLQKVKDGKDAERQAELDAILAEKDEELAPLVAECEKETTAWNELKAKREEAEAYLAEHRDRYEIASAKLESTFKKLEKITAKIAEAEAAVAAASSESNKVTSESDQVHEQAEKEYEQKMREHEEYVAARSKLTQQKEELEGQRKGLVAELKDLKAANKQQEKKINSILPEHLQRDISSDISDEETIDHSKFKLDDASIPEPPPVKVEEPKKEPVDYGFTEDDEPKLVKRTEQQPEQQPEQPEEPEEPVADVSTSEPAAVEKLAAVEEKPAKKKKEGLGKRFLKFMTQEPPKPRKKVKASRKAAPQAKETKKEPSEEAADAFSNFSQGSEVAEK